MVVTGNIIVFRGIFRQGLIGEVTAQGDSRLGTS